MRLVCPNCEAKYEVPEDAIPETGRDVQCANCGHAWYQMRSRPAAPEPAQEPAAAVPVAPALEPLVEAPAEIVAPEAVSEPVALVAEVVEAPPNVEVPVEEVQVTASPEPEAVVEEVIAAEAPVIATEVEEAAAVPESVEAALATTASVVEAAAEAVTSAVEEVVGVVAESTAGAEASGEITDDDAPEEGSDLPDAGSAKPAAYAVDESVLAILREEAEREVRARRGELKPLETQTDLGIEAAIPPVRKTVEIISSDEPVVAATASVDQAEDTRPTTRRDLLPDVEEINSTLRPTEQGPEAGPDPMIAAAEGRSSFRSGFLLAMTLTILAAVLYMSADTLSNLIPALAGPLKAFTGFVDSLRLQLDGLMQTATVAINGDGG